MDKKESVNKPTSSTLSDGSYYNQEKENLFKDAMSPNIRAGIIANMTKNIFFNFDLKYTFIDTKTKATVSRQEEDINLNRLSSSLGVGFSIK